jgi:hypothetical protein
MPVFDFTNASGPQIRGPGHRIYWIVTAPLTFCVLCGYLGYFKWAQRKNRKEDKNARDGKSLKNTARLASPLMSKSPKSRRIDTRNRPDINFLPMLPKFSRLKRNNYDLEAHPIAAKKNPSRLADANLEKGETSHRAVEAPLPDPLAFVSFSDLTSTNPSDLHSKDNTTTLEAAGQSVSSMQDRRRLPYTLARAMKTRRTRGAEW